MKKDYIKTLAISLALSACAGCSMIKSDPARHEFTRTEIVTITINRNGDLYSTRADWICFDSNTPDNTILISFAESTCLPNSWSAMRVVEDSEDYRSTARIMIDGEMIETGYGFGSSLTTFITPNEDTVHGKGVFSVATEEYHFEVPFNGDFNLGEAETIYERTEYFGQNSFPELDPEYSEDLFKH